MRGDEPGLLGSAGQLPVLPAAIKKASRNHDRCCQVDRPLGEIPFSMNDRQDRTGQILLGVSIIFTMNFQVIDVSGVHEFLYQIEVVSLE